jgi:hypothetical protein
MTSSQSRSLLLKEALCPLLPASPMKQNEVTALIFMEALESKL